MYLLSGNAIAFSTLGGSLADATMRGHGMTLRIGLLMIGGLLGFLCSPWTPCWAQELDINRELDRLGYPTANFFEKAPEWFHEADARLDGSLVRPKVWLRGVRAQFPSFEYRGVLNLPLQLFSLTESGTGPKITPYSEEKETKSIYLHEYGHAYFLANTSLSSFDEYRRLRSAREDYIGARDGRRFRDRDGYLNVLKQLCTNIDDERLLAGEAKCSLLPRWESLLTIYSAHQELFADAFAVILMNDAGIISRTLAAVFPKGYGEKGHHLRSFLSLSDGGHSAIAIPELCSRDGVTEYACTYPARQWIWSRYQSTQLTPAAFLKKLLGLLEDSINTDVARGAPASRGADILSRLKDL
jgi:hypothetical protein